MKKSEGYDFLKNLVGDLAAYIDKEKKQKEPVIRRQSDARDAPPHIFREVKDLVDQHRRGSHASGDEFSMGNLPGSIISDNGPFAMPEKYNTMPYPMKDSECIQPEPKADTQMFRDNRRQIDFIIAYSESDDDDPVQSSYRKCFQRSLVEDGLELEVEEKEESEGGEITFIKIHAPWYYLIRYAEVLKIKKPVKDYVVVRGGEMVREGSRKKKKDIWARFGKKNPFNYNEDLITPEPQMFSAGFQMKREEMFLIKDRDNFFSQSQRCLMVWDLLRRAKYCNKDLGFGIDRLIANGTYEAAYPLHDGPYEKDSPGPIQSDRRLLYLEWARASKWYKKQPLHLVRRYFGDKMALYFAWLGFYTEMLIPASILGIFTFSCGLMFMKSEFNKPTEEICSSQESGNTTMCPACDEHCYFWSLSASCLTSKITSVFDNPATVFFSIGMSFWATMFLELWKRKEVVIQWQWDMENYEDEEEIRPEYEESVRTTKLNPLTRKEEPFLSFVSKLGRYVAANSVVVLMLLMVVAALFGVILYRIVITATILKTNSEFFDDYAKLTTSITAASLNLCLILIMNYFYEKIVFWLTNLEMPRTQTEYEDSFTLKMFLFQFVNFYTSLIYIAFFKGRFFYHPGDEEARKNVVLSLRYDVCDPAGCIFDLFVQLTIIMIGKQFANNIIELLLPILRVWWNKRQNKDNHKLVYTRWEQDYDLAEYTRLSLFSEYLEMVIQYGFVTLFVAAFPLAPLFALLNNVVEIRLDAYKYLTKMRRPLPQRVQDIGIWYSILKAITYAAVLSNALVISYTSDFIPRLVYMYEYSNGNFSLQGYILNSLSVFDTAEFKHGMGPSATKYNRTEWPDTCHYRAYREPPWHAKPYTLKLQFWHVFTARMVFIFIFEHIVFLLTTFLAWAIPDIPVEVKNQISMEKKVEKEMLLEAELKKVKEDRKRVVQESDRNQLEVDLGESNNSRAPSRSPSRASMTPVEEQ